MADSYNKKAVRQKKLEKRKTKQERREERKLNNDKGKNWEEMVVYLDEFGQPTDVPPEKQIRTEIELDDILLGAAPVEIVEEAALTGVVKSFFSDKGYGFIQEDISGDTVFVHANHLTETIAENDRVTFEKEKTTKGFAAINVQKIK
ncbi:MAG: cold shock domain-containing protein [Flavobacteriia bacterium]|nr:cold shock domain-containing protein [Flavobacteriia bacterium]